jgi:hypothetical protein
MMLARHGLCRLSVSTVTMVFLLPLAEIPSNAQLIPAGESAAVLSFIDAAAGRVEVVRHWPRASADVDVYPFIPYPWGGCPGPGSIMVLVTGPGSVPSLALRIAQALARGPRASDTLLGVLQTARIAAALRTPGDPAEEALKAALPWISDLATYERLGYAVFLFIHQQGFYCAVTFKAVPEGYGIPFVE